MVRPLLWLFGGLLLVAGAVMLIAPVELWAQGVALTAGVGLVAFLLLGVTAVARRRDRGRR